jgi:hypothetical protein
MCVHQKVAKYVLKIRRDLERGERKIEIRMREKKRIEKQNKK